jgi:integrase
VPVFVRNIARTQPGCLRNEKGKRIQNVHNGFKAAYGRAKLADLRVHDLRHTCASWLVQAGVPLLEVSKLLGHSTIETTERYAHLAPENLQAAVGVLNRLQSGYAGGENAEKSTA